MNQQIYAEQFLYGFYIKYEKLKELTLQAFKDSTAESVNIYIDLYSALLGLYNSNLVIGDYSIVSSAIINLCSHFRDYFRRVHRVESKIFLIYSENNSSMNKQYIQNYNEKSNNLMISFPKVKDMVDNNIKLLQILVPYLPDIYIITNNVEPSVMIYNTIKKIEAYGNTNPNIVLSRDIYTFQLPAINSNITIYRPKKQAGADTSYFVSSGNVMMSYIMNTRDTLGLDPYVVNSLSPALLSWIIILSNFPSRGLRAIYNIKAAYKHIVQAIDNMVMINGYNFDYNLFQCMQPNNVSEFLVNRFKAIDLTFQYSLYAQTPAANDMTWFIDLVDDDAVRAINNQYFKNNPLDLNRI